MIATEGVSAMNIQRLVFCLAFLLASPTMASPTMASVLSYEASLGSLPDAQGWTIVESGAASPTPTISSGLLQQGMTSFTGYQYWTGNPGSLNFADAPIAVDVRLHIVSASLNVPAGRAGYAFGLIDDIGRYAIAFISSSEVFLVNDQFTTKSSIVDFDSTDGFHDYHLVAGPGGLTLSIDGNLLVSQSLGTLSAEGHVAWFGDGTAGGNNQSELQFLSVGTVGVAEPVSLGLFGLALGGLVAVGRRNARKSA